MAEEKAPTWIIVTTLVMLFISGCWTLATIIPFRIDQPIRSAMVITVTIADIAFLLSLLASMLSYSGMSRKEAMKRISILMFCLGITALIVSIILFSTSYLTKTPPYYPD